MILSFHASNNSSLVYTCNDPTYEVRQSAAGWRLHNVETGVWWHLCRDRDEALERAGERIHRVHGLLCLPRANARSAGLY